MGKRNKIKREFDLRTLAGWEALYAAWRIARAKHGAVLDEQGRVQRLVFDAGPAGSIERQDAERSLRADITEAAELEALRELGRLEDLVKETVTPGPHALLIKLAMFSDAWAYGSFDDETWPVLVADVRRALSIYETSAVIAAATVDQTQSTSH